MFGQSADYAKSMKEVEKLDIEIIVLEQRLAELRAKHDKILRDLKPKAVVMQKVTNRIFNQSLALLTDLYQMTMAYGY